MRLPYLLGLFLAAVLGSVSSLLALGREQLLTQPGTPGSFALAQPGRVAPLLADRGDFPGVLRGVRDLQKDLERVTGLVPALNDTGEVSGNEVVLIGTLGKNALIDRLVAAGKLDVSRINGRWEAFLIRVVEQPFPGVQRALVIAGSDKRGTLYGIYEVSEQIGVSPWYWWADVPVRKSQSLQLRAEGLIDEGPVVKYRGIFLNDEAPALAGWAREKFGNFNSAFYAHVFELILRLRGNYLWPAMWSNAFNDDDPENPRLADEYGIVMGTSHHEPMVRSQQEWARFGKGHWDYVRNEQGLKEFWTEGIRRNKHFESIVTLGMRGDGDMPMSEGENVDLLQKIVSDQRQILADHINPDITKIPQLWALYKEVQGYYEKGMRVPDDVTLLWCDDNWGNIRRLPTKAERSRSGGAGIYYHFDYVGGPRSYKWLNTYHISKVWEQMNLAWQYEATRIWIVNVGDLKPMEFPIEFFLSMAWNPARWPHDKLVEYTETWAARDFGEEHAKEVASLISGYTRLNALRKPELLAPDSYSLVNYREAEGIIARFRSLEQRAEALQSRLPKETHDAFYQLVLHPIKACALVTDLNITAGLNKLYAVQGRTVTNALAERAFALFEKDAALTWRYNEELGNGRWRHFMAQNHLGYTYWQQPTRNVMPAVQKIQVPEAAELGVSIEGSEQSWPSHDPNQRRPRLLTLSSHDATSPHIELFNRGARPADFSIETNVPWLSVSQASGTLQHDQRIQVKVDWEKAPLGASTQKIIIRGSQAQVFLDVPLFKLDPSLAIAKGAFLETQGCVAIEAEHFSKAVSTGGIEWKVLPEHGRTLSGVTSFPVTADSSRPGGNSPHLEYQMHLFSAGEAKIELLVSPTLNFQPGRGLRIALSLDDEEPKIIDILGQNTNKDWEQSVIEGVRRVVSTHSITKQGAHVLKIWRVDPAVVLQRIHVNLGGQRPSTLGPWESPRR